MREKPARGIAGRAALLLAAFAVSALLGEAAVRIAGVAPDVAPVEAGRFRLSKNPKIGFEPLPGVDYHGDSMDLFAYRGAGNRLGYRDRDHAIEKPAGAFRIVVIGDSIGAGLYVPDTGQTFPALLEKMLREKGIPAEVINLSVVGYNTRQEVETLMERGLQYDPDLVLLAYCLNDRALNEGGILDLLLEQARNPGAIPGARAGHPWLLHSALYRFLRYRAFPSARRALSGEVKNGFDALAADTTEESLRDLGRVAAARRLRVLVAIFPELTNLSDYRYEGEHRRIVEISDQAGLEHIDLLDTFKLCEAMADGEIGYDRYHPTPPGHFCAADAIAAYIEEHLRPPRAAAR